LAEPALQGQVVLGDLEVLAALTVLEVLEVLADDLKDRLAIQSLRNPMPVAMAESRPLQLQEQEPMAEGAVKSCWPRHGESLFHPPRQS